MNPDSTSKPDPRPAEPIESLDRRSDEINVSSMHAAIMRERAEPKEGREPISLWLITFVGVTLFWGGLYLQRYSGNYGALIYDEKAALHATDFGASSATNAPVDPIKLGRRVFRQICQSCHQENGLGLPGQYPPLSQSDWVLAAAPGRLIRIVLNGVNGPIQVGTQSFENLMPAWRDVLSDAEIAGVLTFVRQEWGNKASEVKLEQVTAIREKTKSRGSPGVWTPWTATELKAIAETE
jgi:mono/diheme cytochrome c family protein